MIKAFGASTGLMILTMYFTTLPQSGQSFLEFFKFNCTGDHFCSLVHKQDVFDVASFRMLIQSFFQSRIGVTQVQFFASIGTGNQTGCKVPEKLVI